MKTAVTIHDMQVAVKADKDFARAFKSANPVLVNGVTDTLTKMFVEMIRIEHSGDLESADQMNDAYWEVAAILLKHLDETGITAAIGRHAHLVKDFDFSRQATEMVYDHLFMVQQLGVPDAKARKFWNWCEANKTPAITALARPGYKLQSTVKKARAGFKGEGEPWMHMSPRMWMRLGGVALMGVNVAGALGTIGVAGGLCIASGVAGFAALVHG